MSFGIPPVSNVNYQQANLAGQRQLTDADVAREIFLGQFAALLPINQPPVIPVLVLPRVVVPIPIRVSPPAPAPVRTSVASASTRAPVSEEKHRDFSTPSLLVQEQGRLNREEADTVANNAFNRSARTSNAYSYINVISRLASQSI